MINIFEEKFFERRKPEMIEVCVTVNYNDRKIKQLAEEQVKKQWSL